MAAVSGHTPDLITGATWSARAPLGTCFIDTTPPVLAIVSPSPGSTLSPDDEIVFTITDNNGLRRVLVAALYDNQVIYEIAHDGDSFAPVFAPGSSRSEIDGGFQYNLKRLNGWPGPVTLRFFCIDIYGNEA